MAEILVDAKSRADRGKNAARRLRASGRIPAIVYGGKKDALAVSVDPKTLLRVLRSESGRNTILSLDLGDAGKASAILKSWQVDPVNEKFIHADFYRIAMDVAIRVKIPILAKGEARGVNLRSNACLAIFPSALRWMSRISGFTARFVFLNSRSATR